MTYQGARARPIQSEKHRFFNVSKLRMDLHGRVSHVLWCEVNAKSNLDVSKSVVVPVGDVVDAIHDGAVVSAVFRVGMMPPSDHSFEVLEHDDGTESIAFAAHVGSGPSVRPSLRELATLTV